MFGSKTTAFFLISLLMLCNFVPDATGQTAASHIATGRGQLTSQTLAGLQAADSSFSSALALEPANQVANVLKASTRLALLFGKPEFQTMLAGVGVTVTNNNPYRYAIVTNEDAAGLTIPAANSTSDMVLSYVNTTLLPEINVAIANLQQVTDQNFLLLLSAAETSLLATNVDYGDVQIALSALFGAKSAALLANTHNISVSLPVLYNLATLGEFNAEKVLDCYPALLIQTGLDQRALSKAAFQSANAAYQAGSNFIRNIRSAPAGTDFLFYIDSEEVVREQRFRTRLAGISAALEGPTLIEGRTINLVPALTTDIQARSLLPQLTGDLALPNTWPDVTLAGALPFGTQAMLNQAAKDVNLLYGSAVTITANPSPVGAGFVSGGGGYRAGYDVTVTASPFPGFSFVNWTENGIPVSTSASYSFIATVNRTLVANFNLSAGYYSITASASPVEVMSDSGYSGAHASGSSVTLGRPTKFGYSFVNWTENGIPVSTSSIYTFIVSANRNLVANFAPAFTITTSASPLAYGFTASPGVIGSGSSVTVSAYPNPGYTLVNWTENGTPVSTSANYTFTATANRTLVANFALTPGFYLITASASPAAGGFASGSGGYSPGSTVFAIATTYPGFGFVNWTENGSVVSTSTSYSFTATANRNLVANFATACTITTSASPLAYGSTSSPTSSPATVGYGSSVTVSAYRNNGFNFVNWTENGTQVSTSQDYTFLATANRSLVANFTLPAGYYVITTGATPAGGGTSSPTGAYSPDSPAFLSAFPSPGYSFVNWTENGAVVSTSSNYTVTASANRTLVANFTLSPGYYLITTSASPVAGGFTLNGIYGAASAGSSVTVSAGPNPGYGFVNWTENGSVVSTSSFYTFIANANRNLVANFTTAYTVTTSASPVAGGTTYGPINANAGSSVTVNAYPNPGYGFVNWTENGIPLSTSQNYTFTATANRNLVANFAPLYTITTSASPAAGGSTFSDVQIVSGSSVKVVATPNADYSFVNWTENGTPVSTAASYTFTVTGNRNLVANFTPSYVVIASPSSGGSLGGTSAGSISGPGFIAPGFGITVVPGSSVNLSATPNSGFGVLKWMVDGAVAQVGGNNFSLSNVTGNRTVSVTFRGNGQSDLQNWRQTWFNTTANSGAAANATDPFRTGLTNLMAFAFFGPNQNPALARINQLPLIQKTPTTLSCSFNQLSGVSGIIYGAESTVSLSPPNWQPVTDVLAGSLHTFTVPIGANTGLFMRLTVTPQP